VKTDVRDAAKGHQARSGPSRPVVLGRGTVGHMAVSRSYGNRLPWSRKNRWVRGFYRDAEEEVGQRGERAVERLRGRIGPTVVLYELLDPPGAGPQGTGTLFVVDVGEDLRSAAGP